MLDLVSLDREKVHVLSAIGHCARVEGSGGVESCCMFRQREDRSGMKADVQSCHRGSSSVLRLPGMRKRRVSASVFGKLPGALHESYSPCSLALYRVTVCCVESRGYNLVWSVEYKWVKLRAMCLELGLASRHVAAVASSRRGPQSD